MPSIPFWDLGQQCRPRTRRQIRVYNVCLQEFLSKIKWKWKSTPDTPETENGLAQLIRKIGKYVLKASDMVSEEKRQNLGPLVNGYCGFVIRWLDFTVYNAVMLNICFIKGSINMMFIGATKIKRIAADLLKTAFRFLFNAMWSNAPLMLTK